MGNPVPPHREPVPTTCRTIFCYFDNTYAFQFNSKPFHTSYDIRNTKLQPLYTSITSYIIVSSFLLIVRHTNSLNFYILTQNRVSSYKPIINFLTYPITRLIPKTHKALKPNEITPYLAMIFNFLGVGFFLSSLLFSNST